MQEQRHQPRRQHNRIRWLLLPPLPLPQQKALQVVDRHSATRGTNRGQWSIGKGSLSTEIIPEESAARARKSLKIDMGSKLAEESRPVLEAFEDVEQVRRFVCELCLCSGSFHWLDILILPFVTLRFNSHFIGSYANLVHFKARNLHSSKHTSRTCACTYKRRTNTWH